MDIVTTYYSYFAFLSIFVFCLVHVIAEKMPRKNLAMHDKFLSLGSGLVIAFVFIDLLPKLAKSQNLIRGWMKDVFPYLEHHVYLLALTGFLLFYVVDRVVKHDSKDYFWFSMSSYALFNFFVGYAVMDRENPDVRPLLFFTVAMALHYFVNDYHLNKDYHLLYRRQGKWLLILSLLAGGLFGLFITLPPQAVALPSAFIAGGVIMNVMRHELPKNNLKSDSCFILGAIIYTILLLTIG